MGTVPTEQIIEVEMTKILIGAAIALAMLASVFAAGISVEKVNCDNRFKVAEQKARELEDQVRLIVEQYEQTVDLKEKENADKLKLILARLSTTVAEKCHLDPADLTDAGRLRDGPASPRSR